MTRVRTMWAVASLAAASACVDTAPSDTALVSDIGDVTATSELDGPEVFATLTDSNPALIAERRWAVDEIGLAGTAALFYANAAIYSEWRAANRPPAAAPESCSDLSCSGGECCSGW